LDDQASNISSNDSPDPSIPRVITLTTDFGLRDWYVAAMRGVILGINPRVTIVDNTHLIPPGDITSGSFALDQMAQTFPSGSIHIAVVDPGVGSDRPALVAACDGHYFVGPGNGLLDSVLARSTRIKIHKLNDPAYQRHPVSSTFHGRDLFAPAAAHLSLGLQISEFGEALPLPARSQPLGASQHLDRGKVVYIDHYGNAITDISAAQIAAHVSVLIQAAEGTQTVPIVEFYSQAPPETATALVGSSGKLELAVNRGSAAKLLNLQIGTEVRLLRNT
jgi:S-adenosyl-L-methionine hydrolase (adenosine-forming)